MVQRANDSERETERRRYDGNPALALVQCTAHASERQVKLSYCNYITFHKLAHLVRQLYYLFIIIIDIIIINDYGFFTKA